MSRPPTGPPGTFDEAAGDAPGFSSASLAPVWQLNALFLETLIQSSRHPAWHGSSWDMALGPRLSDRLPTLQDELSRTPVSLVDIGLNDGGSRPLLSGPGRPVRPLPPFLARDRALHLAHLTVSLGWTLARSDVVATSIVFGVSRSQATALGALAFHSIPKIAERLSGAVRPRWMNGPRIWQRLLGFPERSTAAWRLPPICTRPLQRQFADLLPATSAAHLLHSSRP